MSRPGVEGLTRVLCSVVCCIAPYQLAVFSHVHAQRAALTITHQPQLQPPLRLARSHEEMSIRGASVMHLEKPWQLLAVPGSSW